MATASAKQVVTKEALRSATEIARPKVKRLRAPTMTA